MESTEQLAELRSLQARCDAIRQSLEISPPGTVIYLAPMDVIPDDTVVVEADGFGGATTSVVEGNYPVDYITKFERSFASEGEAERAAEEIAFQGSVPRTVLGVGL